MNYMKVLIVVDMQKDFVDIIAKAAAQKVSDVHIEVADQTTIFFRIDGSMQPVMEYNSQWGESFVRAAFWQHRKLRLPAR